ATKLTTNDRERDVLEDKARQLRSPHRSAQLPRLVLERPRTRRPRGQGAAAALTDAVDGFAYRPDPPTRFVHRGRCRLDWSLAPRVASSCELPQGRKAARVSELWRVHGESSFS